MNIRTVVRRGIQQRNLRRVRIQWPRQLVGIPLLLQRGEKVRHEQARQHERARHPTVADVLLDVGFAVEMRHVRHSALRDLGDVEERREDQVLHAGGLAGVRDGFPLCDFDIPVRAIPEVGHEEDGVGAGDGIRDGVRRGHVGLLERQSAWGGQYN